MSTIMVKVCEQCGRQSTTGDGWLIIRGLDIRSARDDEVLVREADGVDLCSPGCVVRYVQRALEPVMHHHNHVQRHAELDDDEGPKIRQVA